MRLMPNISARSVQTVVGLAFALALCPVGSPGARAQTSNGNVGGVIGTAGHDLVMNANVPPSCAMSSSGTQILLTGFTDSGQTVNTTLTGQGGVAVDCNTPYALYLQRSAIYSPTRPRPAVASADPAQVPTGQRLRDATALAMADGEMVVERELDVTLRVAGRDGPLESHCVMASANEANFLCHALAGPDDARLPMPRTNASLIVTGSLPGAKPVAGGNASAAPVREAALQAGVGTDGAAVAVRRDSGTGSKAAVMAVAKARAERVRIGDRLTVTLSARQ